MPGTDTDNDELRRQVAAIIDRQEITDLVSRLGLMLDEKRMDDARSIFTEDVELDFPSGVKHGVDLLIDHGRQSLAAFDRIHHVITNVLVDLDGDRAGVRANLVATHVKSADRPDDHFDTGAYYEWDAVRTPDGWRLSRVKLVAVFVSGSMDEQWMKDFMRPTVST